jgi:hypothetical protein
VYYLGTLITLLSSGWWYVYQLLENGEAFVPVFLKENVKRIYALESDPFYYYLLDIPVSFLPYSFLVYPALFWSLRKDRLTFPAVWFLSFLAVFSLVKMKLPLYIMPAFPAMALLTGHFLREVKGKLLTASLVLLGALVLIAMWAAGVAFNPDVPLLLILSLFACLPLFFRDLKLFPAYSGVALLVFVSVALLPLLEEHRPYREIGRRIKEVDPGGGLRTYEEGVFHQSLPFYAERPVIRGSPREGPALLLTPRPPEGCRVLGSWKVYRGSESRFLKFLRDVKEGRNFSEFYLCIFRSGG